MSWVTTTIAFFVNVKYSCNSFTTFLLFSTSRFAVGSLARNISGCKDNPNKIAARFFFAFRVSSYVIVFNLTEA